jgi:hypothetical protein
MTPFNLGTNVMQHRTLLVAGLGVAALMACAGVSQADGRKVTIEAGPAIGEKARHSRKGGSAGRRHLVLRGGYAYGRSEVTNTYEFFSRAPYAWVDQSPGGPFDSGFFFDSGIRPLNNAPYPGR